ncbi:MAG TPA: PPC domain-containing protein, partial [Candidatus Paceibacterota bacterium]|nr:PPC domain-containing protein [Candidatus Paceibacterota bacterium]
YTIETWAGTLSDNYMYLYGPNSQTILIAEDDDSGEGSAAKIVQSLVPGTYYVRIRAYSPSGTGTYMIRVTGGGGGSAITTLLVNGSSAKGDISPAGDEDWYQFTASSWGTYTIETWAGTLTDNYMYLYGPDNQKTLMAEDDDSGEGQAAKIVQSLSPGTYYVKVRAYSSADTGTYSIRVTTDGGGGGPIITPLTVSGRGEEGNIEKAGEEDWYEFTVSSSGLYTVATWGLSLRDTYIYLYGPDNQKALIAEDDDGGQGVAARILHWLSRGTYFVKVVGHAHVGVSDGTGTCWIQVTDDADHHMAALTVNGPMVTGSISQVGHADWYQFTASSSGTYTIETWPGTLLDNHMHLYGPGSQTTKIAEDDDSGTGDAAKIVRSLSPGVYYVEVWAYSVADTGTYTIRVTK